MSFSGNFVNCILEANHSAQKLLEIISENFVYFQDESIYNGQTGDIFITYNILNKLNNTQFCIHFLFLVAIYKRAQILIADIWSSFRGIGFGEFHDIDTLTMFADYR